VQAGAAAHAESVRARTPQQADEQEHWWQTQLAFVARAREEGARMISGSDAACEGVIPGYGLHDQLDLLVQAGLSPLEALRTVTVEPAAYLGREADSGRIAENHVADIVLLRSDPRSNIAAIRDINAVVLRGHALGSDALQEIKSAAAGGRASSIR
jgi:imidazolonepropionase-like amidohydrolase